MSGAAIKALPLALPQVWQEWQKKVPELPEGFVMLVPTDCSVARARGGTLKEKADDEQRDAKCWYELPTFRRLFPEYNDLSDMNLLERAHSKAGIQFTRPQPFWILGQLLVVGILMPLVLLGFGAALAWVLRGFRAPLQRS
jgi:hypothetical protein